MSNNPPNLRAIEADLRKMLRKRGDDPRLLVQLAGLAASAGRLKEAEPLARKACELAPLLGPPFFCLALILRDQRRLSEADAALTRAIVNDPQAGPAWLLRGVARMELGALEAAIADFDEARKRLPDPFEALAYESNALRLLGRMGAALAAIEAALARRPNAADALRARAMVLGASRRHEEAASDIDRAIEMAPRDADAWAAKGDLRAKASHHAEAIEAFERALTLAPGRKDILEHLITTRRAACDWRNFAADEAQIGELARDLTYPLHPFRLLSFATTSSNQLANAAKYVNLIAPPLAISAPKFAPRVDGAPIRVAYLSADLRTHAVSHNLVGIIEQHDRQRFEISAISVGADDASPMRRRMEAAFGAFVDASTWSDERIVRHIREQRIDILVDVNGLSGEARLGVAARRAAPVQVAYLGYPGTTGAPYFDYVIADRWVIPPADRQNFSERVVWLPGTYQPNDDRRMVNPAPSRAELGLPDDGFVFCCFNASFKHTPSSFDGWMRILLATPGSMLWLTQHNATAVSNLRREAEARGVSAERLVFAPFAEQPVHLARLSRADLVLDENPYNGHTTTSDALWVGAPVLTFPGETFVSRVAGSLLRAAGLPELICDSEATFEATAIAFGREPERLRAIREKLATMVRSSALFDTEGYARKIERAFEAMHGRWTRGEAPADIEIAD